VVQEEYIKWGMLILQLIYSYPLFKLRYRYRTYVYNDESWDINIKPWFWKEIKYLFYPTLLIDIEKISFAKKYRLYLLGYTLLWGVYLYL